MNNLDQLLEDSGGVDSPRSEVMLAARAVVTDEAHAAALRAAQVVRLRRRHRRLAVGVAAAAVAGIVAVPLLGGVNSHSERFSTVAQVTDAAAAATTANGPIDPTAAPYWKVVTSWKCDGDTPCTSTMWVGIGRPGVSDSDGPKVRTFAAGPLGSTPTQTPEATVTIDGQELPWKQVNARSWTDAQVATMVADNSNGTKADRPPSSFYVFKEAIGLLTYAPASPTIRKQLWRELAAVPGVALDGRAKDSLGRTGWKLTLTTPGVGNQWLLVDPNTGMMLENGGRGPNASDAGWVTTVVSAGPADTAPAALTPQQIQQMRTDAAHACGLDKLPPRDPTSLSLISPDQKAQMGEAYQQMQACMQSHLQGGPLLTLPLAN